MKRLLAILLVIVVGLFLAKDFIVKYAVEFGASRALGAKVSIGALSFRPLQGHISIKELKVYNPEGFPYEPFLDIPEISVDMRLKDALKGRLCFNEIGFRLKEVVLITNQDGMTNIDALKISQEKEQEADEEKPKTKERAISIDTINIEIGRIVIKELEPDKAPSVSVKELNIKKEYKHITSMRDLALLLIAEPLKAGGVKGLKVFAASAITGVAALPVAAIMAVTSKDHSDLELPLKMEQAYELVLQVIGRMGQVKQADKSGHRITAVVQGVGVNVSIESAGKNKSKVVVSARKWGLPKPDIAAGVAYEIEKAAK